MGLCSTGVSEMLDSVNIDTEESYCVCSHADMLVGRSIV